MQALRRGREIRLRRGKNEDADEQSVCLRTGSRVCFRNRHGSAETRSRFKKFSPGRGGPWDLRAVTSGEDTTAEDQHAARESFSHENPLGKPVTCGERVETVVGRTRLFSCGDDHRRGGCCCTPPPQPSWRGARARARIQTHAPRPIATGMIRRQWRRRRSS